MQISHVLPQSCMLTMDIDAEMQFGGHRPWMGILMKLETKNVK